MRTGVIPGLERSQQTPIATTKVRYVGDPVAVVVAENRYLAEDALELIDVEYHPLGAVTDARASMQPGAPQLHDATPNNIAANFQVNVGEVDAAFAALRSDLRRRLFDPAPFRRAAGESRPGRRVGRRPRLSNHVGTDQDDPHQLAHSLGSDRPAAELHPFHRAGSGRRLRRARRILSGRLFDPVSPRCIFANRSVGSKIARKISRR